MEFIFIGLNPIPISTDLLGTIKLSDTPSTWDRTQDCMSNSGFV